MIELLKQAQSAGHHADYVLFDTWFSNPAQLIAMKELGLDSIAMIKRSSRIHYEFEGKQLSVNRIRLPEHIRESLPKVTLEGAAC